MGCKVYKGTKPIYSKNEIKNDRTNWTGHVERMQPHLVSRQREN